MSVKSHPGYEIPRLLPLTRVGVCPSEARCVEADKRSPGRMTRDEDVEAEALSDPEMPFGFHGGSPNSKNVNFCFLFSLNTVNLTGVELWR